MRRYQSMKPSRGTVIPPLVRLSVYARDNGCVGRKVGFPVACGGSTEVDHVRAGGMGLKSRTTADNCVQLCSFCHRYKTEHGREARPLLLAYLSNFEVAA